jgi:hypothetical protein
MCCSPIATVSRDTLMYSRFAVNLQVGGYAWEPWHTL